MANRSSAARVVRPARLLILGALLAGAACRGVEIMGTAGARGTGTVIGGGHPGGGTTTSALVGRWVRTIVLQTSDGNIHESRTEWEFRADGSAIRRVTTSDVASGLSDTVTAVAQWTTSGSSLTIVWISPTAGTVAFEWRVSGDTLTIGADQYTRVR